MSQNTGTLIIAAVRPNDSTDPIASAWSNELKGGHHMYATISERNGIIVARREWGMLCTVYNDGVNNGTYILNYGGSTASISNDSYWGVYSPGSQIILAPNSGLTYSGGSYSTTNTTLSGPGLTNSGYTFSILLDGSTPGLTVSSSGLRVIDLIMTTSSVKLDTNILGEYTTDPTTLGGWGVYSIPTKGYVDAIASGLTLKQAVRVAATGSVSISSAPSQIDGVTLSSGDRILLWKQDDTVNGTSSNGVYIYNGVGVSMSRSTDMDGNPSSEVTTGVYTFVTEGTTYQGSGFVVVAVGTASGEIQVGTQSMKWTQFSGAGAYVWNNGLINVGNVVDIDLYNSGGLTFSASQLKVDLANNSGLSLTNGLSLDPNIASSGLTFSVGQLSLNLGDGLTFSGGTSNPGQLISNINTNGLTFSSSQLAINMGDGLTFSGSQLISNIGTGLTFSGGQIIFDTVVVGSGLTWSNSQLSLSISATQSQLAFWGTTSSLSSTSNLTWDGSTTGVLNYTIGTSSQIYPLVLENTTVGGDPLSGSVGLKLKSGTATASIYYTKSSGGSKNDNALNIDLPNSGMTIYTNGKNGDTNNFQVYGDQGASSAYFYYKIDTINPRSQFVLYDSNAGGGQSEFVVSQIGYNTKLKGYTTIGALSYGTASQTNNVITFTNQNIYLGSYSSAPTSSVIVEIAPGASSLIPLKLNAGTLATTKQDGAIEYDGTHAYITIGTSSRYQLDNYLIGFGLTASGLTLSLSINSGNGLTSSGNTFSININTDGLTFSGGTVSPGQLSLNIGSGLTFSNGQLNSSVSVSGTTNTVSIFNSGGLTNSMMYQTSANFGNTASNGNSFPIPGAIVIGGKYFGITSSDTLQSVAVRDNSLTQNGTSVYPQLGVSVGLTYSGTTGTASAGVAAISAQVIDGVDNRRSALFTNYIDSLWGISNTGGSGGMTFGIWQSTNRVMTIGANLNVNFQPGSTHSDSGYFFTVGSSSYFKGKITTTFSGSGLQFLGLTSGSSTSTGGYIGVDSTGNVINLTGPLSGNGLTNSGNTFSLNINSNGLTFSSNQLNLNIGNGLTFSSSVLNVVIDSVPSGLTFSNNGLKIRYNTTSGLNIYSSGGATDNQLYIDWGSIIGSGLTWSGAQLNTSSAVLKKYTAGPSVFTASVTQTITHNIGNTEYVIQMYSNGTGDEILSQYSGRSSNTIDITVFEDTSDAKIVIIG